MMAVVVAEMNTAWENIRNNIKTSATASLGYYCNDRINHSLMNFKIISTKEAD